LINNNRFERRETLFNTSTDIVDEDFIIKTKK